MVQSSFYSDTPNYATEYPTQNDSNTNPVTGNTEAPSSFYPNGDQYAEADPAAAAASASAAAASAAAALASQNAAATSETNAGASEAAALASQTAAATSDTNAASSAAAALASQTAAATSETNAAASASNAFTNATSAAGSASAAATSASNAATSATNAATSETNAASSASAAATSASNAAAAVQAAAGTATPLMDGTAAVGTGTKWAREDHRHPTDTSRAPTASPTFTGTVTIPTPTAGDNTTKAASTAYVQTELAAKAPLASPTFTGTPTAPTPTAGDNSTKIATTAFVTTALTGFTAGRTLLTADRTYYVRTDGSDSNNGLTNTAGGAFLTLNKAINTVAALDCSIYNVTISVGAGTFAGCTLKPVLGTGTMLIVGAGSTTIISGGADAAIFAGNVGAWTVNSVKLISTSYHGLFASGATTNIQMTSVEFGTCATSHIRATNGGRVRLFAYSISGSAPFHWQVDNQSNITCVSVTVTLTGTPAFSGSFAVCQSVSYLWAEGVTFVGSATGQRYSASINGVINTAGGGASYLPGSVAGGTATGGVYY